MKAECGYPLYWRGCYRGTYDLWGPESYSHPAKMSVALSFRILEHLQELGLLKDGDKILDPMAGIGTTNIVAGAMGYSSISVELEEKFVNFQKQNKEYAEKRLFKSLDWQMLQGDSRKLSELLQGQGLVSVMSPPHADSIARVGGDCKLEHIGISQKMAREYDTTEGQIGNLRDTPLKSITSPPYEESLPNGLDRKAAEQMVQAMYNKHGRAYSKEDFEYQVELILKRSNREYGDAEGQIGKLKDKPLKSITSPPYEQSITGGKSGIEWQEEWGKPSESRQPSQDISYGESKENIGNLKDTPLKAITSPPYSDSKKGEIDADKWATFMEQRDINLKRNWGKDRHTEGRLKGAKSMGSGYSEDKGNIGNLPDKPLKSVMSPPHGLGKGTGHADNKRDTRPILKDRNVNLAYNDENPDNIGNTQSESYLQAMSKVYREISLVSDVLVVVVKNPTRGGKLRRLDLDTIRVLEMAGWEIHCRHRALLFEELEQGDLFGGSKKQVKGRLSFFKRLSWQNGQPVASWEDVIIAIRK